MIDHLAEFRVEQDTPRVKSLLGPYADFRFDGRDVFPDGYNGLSPEALEQFRLLYRAACWRIKNLREEIGTYPPQF
jgi:hypothetical protein